MGKRVLITGYGGFIGQHLSGYLHKAGHTVYGVVRKKQQTLSDEDVTILEGNILIETDMHDIVQTTSPDIIYHFAAQSRVGQSFTHPGSSLETNILGTAYLLEAIRKNRPDCRVIFASSAEVYGNIIQQSMGGISEWKTDDLSLSEDLNPSPTTSPYSISKICGEYLLTCYHKSYGLDSVIVRSFNIEGPGRGDTFVTSTICKQAAELSINLKKGYTIGNLAIFRDFTHVSDAVRAYSLIGQQGVSGRVYNLGSKQMTSLASFLLYATESSGFPVDEIVFGDGTFVSEPLHMVTSGQYDVTAITALDACLLSHPDLVSPEKGVIILRTRAGEIPVRIDPTRFRPAENPVMVADTRRIAELGYYPTFSVDQIAAEQVQYYLKQGVQKS